MRKTPNALSEKGGVRLVKHFGMLPVWKARDAPSEIFNALSEKRVMRRVQSAECAERKARNALSEKKHPKGRVKRE